MMNKTSSPDWVTDLYTCECDLPMCPMCDPDFLRDLAYDLENCWLPDDETPPF